MEPTMELIGGIVTVSLTLFNLGIAALKKTKFWETIKDQMRTIKYTVGTLLAAGLNMYFEGGMTDEMLLAVPPAFVAGSWLGRKAVKPKPKKK